MIGEGQDSLLLGNGEQLSLLDGDVDSSTGLPASAFASAEARGRFTGERLFLENPKLYRAVVALLGRGSMGYREIAEVCQVSVNTVCGVSVREGVPIETISERIGRLGLDVAALSLEAIREMLADPTNHGKFTLKDLSVAFGISTSNAQLLLGRATARVETVPLTEPGHDDFVRLLAKMTKPAEKNVTPPPMGLGAGTSISKEGGALTVNDDVQARPNIENQSQQDTSTP